MNISRPRKASAVAAVAVTFAAALVPVGSAAAQDAPTTLVGEASDRCLAPSGGAASRRAPVVIADCDDEGIATWTRGDGGTLRLDGSSLCLDVRGEDVEPRGVVQVYPCHGRDNQQWELRDDGTIVGAGSGLCLDVARARTAAGSELITWPCHGRGNQQWAFAETDTPPDDDPPGDDPPGDDDPVGDRNTEPGPSVCEDDGVCVEGRGVRREDVDDGASLYRDDEDRRISFPDDVPGEIAGLWLMTYDDHPADELDRDGWDDDLDTRTDDEITRVRTDTENEVLVAVASADAADGPWERVSGGDGPDFRLDRDGDDAGPAYWLYRLDDPPSGTWVEMPDQSDDAAPSFVFGPPEGMTFANPLPLPAEGAAVAVSGGIFNPTMTVVPGEFDGDEDGYGDGDLDRDGTKDVDVYLAAASGVQFWRVWRSLDEGETWEDFARFDVNLNRQSLFWHRGSVYLMGWVKRYAELPNGDPAQGIIYSSADGGASWDDGTLLPFPAGDAPSNVVVSEGRIWKAAGSLDDDGNHGATLISAPVDADLTDPDSWTAAEGSRRPEWDAQVDEVRTVGSRDVEGVTVLHRDGRVMNISNARSGAAIVTSDGPTRTTHDVEDDNVDLPNRGKFSVVYDEQSDRWWALVNGPNGQPRNVVNLFSSTDLRNWELEREVLWGPSSRFHGFNYPEIEIVGDDMVFVSRTAWEDERGRSDRWHDGNMLTFHRVRDFRDGAG